LGRGEEGIIAVAHLYQAKTRAGTNVPTFVLGGVLARYKCDGLTFVPVRASNRYKCEAFVPVGLDQAPPSPYERTFVPVGGSNRYKCPHLYRWAKYPVQMKNQAWDICVFL
jgi:hypothetical protein